MSDFIMTIGLSASGKTTFAHLYARRFKDRDVVILDSDALRLELCGDASDQSQNARVFEVMFSRAVKALNEDKDVIYCATNLLMKRRRNLLLQLKQKVTNPNVHYMAAVIVLPFEECLKRNAARERSVPNDVIIRQLKQFQMPVIAEGWNKIFSSYGEYDIATYRRTLVEKVEKFGDQRNPHHSLSILSHCRKACQLAYMNEEELSIYTAALFHDYGKIYCQSIDENGVAHYNSHASVSAYLSLCIEHNIEVAQLICYHMVFFESTSTWKTRLGEELWDKLELLHKYDLEAH